MMKRIRPLAAVVANQIAAGEVIERPASVVKELLENALDAGADTIAIEIDFGGLNQIRMSDNGHGIMADDLPLAILAHATSKITALNDLYEINSMGFRGEALASIAAVSRLSLASQTSNQAHAMILHAEGGELIRVSPFARNQGTTVEVRDLFFNVPVRKSFLKTARSEFQAIDALVKRFALSAPDIALTLKHNDKLMFSLPAARCEQTRRQRVRAVLGKAFIEQSFYMEVQQAGMQLYGWVSGPLYQRSQNDKQWVYLNQRMVKDKLIQHAIKQAYGDLLHPGRHPACLLYLTMPAKDVDVNVHPTKHEVRFQQPRWVHDFISTHISALLVTSNDHGPRMQEALPDDRPMHLSSVYEPASLGDREPASRSWFILNAQFVLIYVNDHPYLVDVNKAEQARLLSVLHHQVLPLESRLLSVPVSGVIDKAEVPLFEKISPILEQIGLQLDWIGETELLIRTLPLLCSQLDIKRWWQQLKTICPEHTNLLTSLVAYQVVDAYQLNDERRTQLMAYLQAEVGVAGRAVSWCMRLDIAQCRDILYA